MSLCRRLCATLLLTAAVWAGPVYNVVAVPYANVPWVYSFTDNGWASGTTWGEQVFTSDGATMQVYPTLPGGYSGSRSFVNSSGQVASSYFDGAAFHAVLGTAGVWNQLTGTGFVSGMADNGLIVGGSLFSGAIWESGGYQTVPEAIQFNQVSRSGNAVVGTGYPATPYFSILLRVDGVTTLIPTGGREMNPAGVNDLGVFVSTYLDAGGATKVAVGNSGGFDVLPIEPGRSALLWSQPINNAGQVIYSTYPTGGGTIDQARIWDPVNGVRDLAALAGIPLNIAFAINNAGQILASSNGQVVMLDPISSPVPEPGTFGLLGAGLLVALSHRRVSRTNTKGTR